MKSRAPGRRAGVWRGSAPGCSDYLIPQQFLGQCVSTKTNTDPTAIQITTTDWGVFAAIGEDNFAAGVPGVNNDGTDNVIVVLYGVIGGAGDGAGGVDSPFHFRSGKRLGHKPKKHGRRMTRGLLHTR